MMKRAKIASHSRRPVLQDEVKLAPANGHPVANGFNGADRKNVSTLKSLSKAISEEKPAISGTASAPLDTTSDATSLPPTDWLVWQLMDSAFPTGGFAHSGGLEAAWQQGEVRGRDDLLSFVEASLEQLGHAGLPFVHAAYDAPEKLGEIDALYEAFTSNHVANRASRAHGRAFFSAVERIFSEKSGSDCPKLPCAHFAPVFGASLRRLNIDRIMTGRMFFFNHLRGVMAAAVRLNITGPMEAQRLQYRLMTKAESVLFSCSLLTLDHIAQTAPLLEIWQGAQDRLYSRLFQS